VKQFQRSALGALLLLAAAAPAWAGIHYKALTTTQDARSKETRMQVEGWVSGDNAKVVFQDSNNPMAQEGAYLITKDGGRTVYLVDPKEKTYMRWDLEAMLGMAGAVMEGMGPLLKMEFSEPKVEKLAEGDGGTMLGLPTQHSKYRTSYSMKVRVLGMNNESSIVSEQDIWSTTKLADAGLGVWLRNNPPKLGNEQFDKLIKAEMGKISGYPLKTVTVTTTTDKKGRQSVSRTTMEVTQLDTNASVPASSFEIPAGYEEAQMPTMQGETGEGKEEQGGLGSLLRKRRSGDGDGN
jgi:hypothetical protein